MTEKLSAVIQQAEKLSPADQDALAEAMVIMIDELGWECRFADPRNQEKMQRMAEDALREHAANQSEEWP